MAFYKNGKGRSFNSQLRYATNNLNAWVRQRAGQGQRKRMRSGSSSGSRSSRGRDYGNLTFQNDEHVMYRRKRAPRRVRKAARRTQKRFDYMLNKSLGQRTCVIVKTEVMNATPTNANNAKAVSAVTIYGAGINSTSAGTNINWANGDLWYLFTADTGGPPDTVGYCKYRFKSAVMNLSIKNVATSDGAYRDGMAFVDLYHVLCRKSMTTTGGSGGSPAAVWENACDEQQQIINMNAVTSINTDGVTPFDTPSFGESYIIKRVRRIRLSPLQQFSTQLRDPGDYEIETGDLLHWDHLANRTEGYIIVAWNPSADVATGVRGRVTLEVNYTKSYHYTTNLGNANAIGRSNIL